MGAGRVLTEDLIWQFLRLKPHVPTCRRSFTRERFMSRTVIASHRKGSRPKTACGIVQNHVRVLKKSVLGADLFAVTIPSCAKERCRRDIADDGSASKDTVAVLLLSLAGSDSGRPPAATD